MQIYVEHHNWVWSKKQGGWSGTTVKIFGSKEQFDKYVLEQQDKHKYEEITYFIYECIDGKKGDVLAHLTYNGLQFEGVCINPKWEQFYK